MGLAVPHLLTLASPCVPRAGRPKYASTLHLGAGSLTGADAHAVLAACPGCLCLAWLLSAASMRAPACWRLRDGRQQRPPAATLLFRMALHALRSVALLPTAQAHLRDYNGRSTSARAAWRCARSTPTHYSTYMA
jgi:hypothetical protein